MNFVAASNMFVGKGPVRTLRSTGVEENPLNIYRNYGVPTVHDLPLIVPQYLRHPLWMEVQNLKPQHLWEALQRTQQMEYPNETTTSTRRTSVLI